MAHKRCVRLHAEYKPMLSMLNIVVDLSCCLKDGHPKGEDVEPCFIDIEENAITYRSASDCASFSLPHLQLSPASCRGLRWCQPSELHLSVQASSREGGGVSVRCQDGVISHVEETGFHDNQDIVVDRIKQGQHKCCCAGCGHPVFTSKSVFKRVLPLPSENWSDFADIWFCHNHSHSESPLQQPTNDKNDHCEQPSAASQQTQQQNVPEGQQQQQKPVPESPKKEAVLEHQHQQETIPEQQKQKQETVPEAPQQKNVPESHQDQESVTDGVTDGQRLRQGVSVRPGDCLVSSLYLLVDGAQVSRSIGITPTTQRLVCRRCGNFIGFVQRRAKQGLHDKAEGSSDDVHKIYLHAIKFLNPETNASKKANNASLPLDGISQERKDSVSGGLVENFLCQMFRDQSRLYTSFRFIVQSSYEEQSDIVPIVLLVWLMDQNLEVVSSSCPLTSSSSTSSPPSSSAEVSMTRVLKLLYKGSFVTGKHKKKGHSAEGSLFKMWERDNSVHGLDLPYPLCKQLLSLLLASTRHLPLSQRSLNSFHVGYLHYRPPNDITPN